MKGNNDEEIDDKKKVVKEKVSNEMIKAADKEKIDKKEG